MRVTSLALSLTFLFAIGCRPYKPRSAPPAAKPSEPVAAAPVETPPAPPVVAEQPKQEEPVVMDTSAIASELVAKYGDAQRPQIERGLKQVSALWRPSDGDLA